MSKAVVSRRSMLRTAGGGIAAG
ncbi:MAG: hypothetical protein RLZZ458_3643, partial [Planctomycetota bacterium]